MGPAVARSREPRVDASVLTLLIPLIGSTEIAGLRDDYVAGNNEYDPLRYGVSMFASLDQADHKPLVFGPIQ